jgi:pyruvate dehydrogenase E2 component (dihydrolipoamide acetyltransferase)
VCFASDAIHQYKHADIAFAVALEGGLITPIIRQADIKSITQIAEETKDLVDRAKRNRLKLEEFEGGTFSISNLGMYGIDEFDAIINPPQAAILAVSASKKCPVVKNDELVIATMMNIQLSCDHRVIDGAIAAKFLQVLKGYLENPVSMLV